MEKSETFSIFPATVELYFGWGKWSLCWEGKVLIFYWSWDRRELTSLSPSLEFGPVSTFSQLLSVGKSVSQLMYLSITITHSLSPSQLDSLPVWQSRFYINTPELSVASEIFSLIFLRSRSVFYEKWKQVFVKFAFHPEAKWISPKPQIARCLLPTTPQQIIPQFSTKFCSKGQNMALCSFFWELFVCC